jgi:hypothetical protein
MAPRIQTNVHYGTQSNSVIRKRRVSNSLPPCLGTTERFNQVRKAAQEALDEYKRQHPDMDEEELKAIEVEPPQAPPAPAPVAGPAGRDLMAEADARMRRLMLMAQQQPYHANINFNINFGMAQIPPAVAAPVARPVPAPVVARGRQRRARRG